MAIENWKEIAHGGFLSVTHAIMRTTESTYFSDDELLFWAVTRSYSHVQYSGPATALSYTAIQHWRWLTAAFYLVILTCAFIGILTVPARTLWNSYSRSTFL